jgi:hypothetical protein
MGPTVCDELGPIPILKSSKTLVGMPGSCTGRGLFASPVVREAASGRSAKTQRARLWPTRA